MTLAAEKIGKELLTTLTDNRPDMTMASQWLVKQEALGLGPDVIGDGHVFWTQIHFFLNVLALIWQTSFQFWTPPCISSLL